MPAPSQSENPGYYDSNITISTTPTRPASSYTLHSTFADSAVDMVETPLPGPTPNEASQPDFKTFGSEAVLDDTDVDQTLSNKMRQLAAVAWTLEQGDDMTIHKRSKLHQLLNDFENQLDSDSDSDCEIAKDSNQALSASQEENDQPQGGKGIDETVEEDDGEELWID